MGDDRREAVAGRIILTGILLHTHVVAPSVRWAFETALRDRMEGRVCVRALCTRVRTTVSPLSISRAPSPRAVTFSAGLAARASSVHLSPSAPSKTHNNSPLVSSQHT